MKPNEGQALPEYTLLMSLITLVCVAAMALLGVNLKDGFARIFSEMDAPAGPGAMTLAAAPAGGGLAEGSGPQQTEAAVEAEPASATETVSVRVRFDPATGKITFSGLDDGSAVMNATGANGTRMAAAMLARLALMETLPDGTPVPDSLNALLDRLANGGHQLADMEEQLNPEARRFRASPLAPAYTEFFTAYNDLSAYVADRPELTPLVKQVEDYSGIISSIATYEYYMKDANYDPAKLLQSMPGTRVDAEGVTVELMPETTQQASENIRGLKTP